MPRLLSIFAVALACVGMVWLSWSDAGAVNLRVGTGRALLAGNHTGGGGGCNGTVNLASGCAQPSAWRALR